MTLAPAPWTVDPPCEGGTACAVLDANGVVLFIGLFADLAEQICLWRNAADVMERRSWQPRRDSEKWFVDGECVGILGEQMPYNCPFLALIAADQWMKERGL